MTAWFRTEPGSGIIVAIGSKHQATPYNEQFAFNNNNILYGGGSANDFQFPNTAGYSSTEWYHMAVTKHDNNAHLYINSVYISSTPSHTYATGLSNTQNILIGVWDDWNRYFMGDIDEVRVYDRALNQSEIEAVFTYDAPITDEPTMDPTTDPTTDPSSHPTQTPTHHIP
eukprot:494715_1